MVMTDWVGDTVCHNHCGQALLFGFKLMRQPYNPPTRRDFEPAGQSNLLSDDPISFLKSGDGRGLYSDGSWGRGKFFALIIPRGLWETTACAIGANDLLFPG